MAKVQRMIAVISDNDLDMMIDSMTLNCGAGSATMHQHQCLAVFEELRVARKFGIEVVSTPSDMA